MAKPKDQRQMEAFLQSMMLEHYADMGDAVYGMLHPRFVQCDFDNRTLTVVIHVEPWMRNANHVMHGGAIAAALDGMGGLLTRCYTPADTIAPTCNLSISYILPVPMDAQLHVRMRATHTGRHMLFVGGEAFTLADGAELLHATSMAAYMIVERESE